MKTQDKTIQYYNNNALEYAELTTSANMDDLLEVFLNEIPKGGAILDLGCGAGRDSRTLREKGYTVIAIDGSAELCKIASEYASVPVRCMLFQDLDYYEAFDGIWACSSLHHLYRTSLMKTLPLVFRALKPNGVLYTCFKCGGHDFDDENGRHFTCVTEQNVHELFSGIGCADSSNIKCWITGDNLGGRDTRWVNVMLCKSSN